MRVTNQMMARNAIVNMNDLRSRLESIQQQVSTGKKFVKNSEDPTGGGEVMRMQSRLQVMEQWDRNLGDAKGWLRDGEQALQHMTDLVSRARELSVYGANATLDQESRRALIPETQQLLEDLLQTLNTERTDGMLFAGHKTGSEPFSLDWTTGAVTYTGDAGEVNREIGPGVTLQVNLDGARFGDPAAPDHMLTTMWNLIQDLNNGTSEEVAANMQNLNNSMDQILALRSEIGGKDKRVEMMEMRMQEAYIGLNANLQQAQGVEMEKAIIDLTTAETTYRAALQVGARIMPPTLVDFLR